MTLVLVSVDPALADAFPSPGVGTAEQLREQSRRSRGHGEELALGQTGLGLAQILAVYQPSCDALGILSSGRAVPETRSGEPGQLLSPAQCAQIVGMLAQLNADHLPIPDPEGWGPDPRTESDSKLAELAGKLELHGLEPQGIEEMAQLAEELVALKAFYAGVQARGDGVLAVLG
jgi:hypothetical protein